MWGRCPPFDSLRRAEGGDTRHDLPLDPSAPPFSNGIRMALPGRGRWPGSIKLCRPSDRTLVRSRSARIMCMSRPSAARTPLSRPIGRPQSTVCRARGWRSPIRRGFPATAVLECDPEYQDRSAGLPCLRPHFIGSNIGLPEAVSSTSSCPTSQCSAILPFSTR